MYGIWLVPVSECVNGTLKYYFRVPRPAWVDPKVTMASWSHEYSFPSSHAQIIWALAAFFGGTSANPIFFDTFGGSRLSYWYYLALPYVFASAVSISRVYEGMHYPRDITVGAGIGVGLASVYMRLLPVIKRFLKRQTPFIRMGYLGSIGVILSFITRRAAEHARRDCGTVSSWASNAVASNPEKHTPKASNKGRQRNLSDQLAVKPGASGSPGSGELAFTCQIIKSECF